MCMQTNPELRARMIRETAEEIRKWLRGWLQDIIGAGGKLRSKGTGHSIPRNTAVYRPGRRLRARSPSP
jgi:hypothetical protein